MRRVARFSSGRGLGYDPEVDLIFRATIERIECVPDGSPLAWIVRTRVVEVLSGSFAGERFAFRVHSPARAGLLVARALTVHARWTGTGYTIDEDQWRGTP